VTPAGFTPISSADGDPRIASATRGSAEVVEPRRRRELRVLERRLERPPNVAKDQRAAELGREDQISPDLISGAVPEPTFRLSRAVRA